MTEGIEKYTLRLRRRNRFDLRACAARREGIGEGMWQILWGFAPGNYTPPLRGGEGLGMCETIGYGLDLRLRVLLGGSSRLGGVGVDERNNVQFKGKKGVTKPLS